MAKPWMTHKAWKQSRSLVGEVRIGPGAETAVAMNPVNPDLVIAGVSEGSCGINDRASRRGPSWLPEAGFYGGRQSSNS